MDLTNIKKLIKMVEESSITDLSIEEKDLKIAISKKAGIIQAQYQPVQNLNSTNNSIQAEQAGEAKASAAEKPEEKYHEVCSPIVGTFYRSPAPDAEPYSQVGDQVSSGSVLCIIEAMKLMNEIESDVSGKIVKILVENGSPVEYNQPLFLIKPD